MRLSGAGSSAKPVVAKQPKPFAKAGAGEPLAAGVRPALEERFGVDLSAVRVHAGADAAAAVGALSARAFTRGTDIFLGKGERATDFSLLAHEVAHVVQQQGAPRVQRLSNAASDACEREAHRASDAATRGQQFDVRERTSGTTLQRWGIGDALDRFADLANMIPGYRMFTIVLGVNPINMSTVERSAANIMRAVVEFIPGGGLVTRALDTYGVFERVGGWVEGQIRSLGMTGGAIRQALMDFVGSLSLSDIFDLGGVWDRARRIFTEPISRIISFARGLITGILGFLREAVLRPLAQLAQGTQGYDLLKAVLGQDPVTGEAVPRNADTLIGGFMKLIGQEEVWNNLKRANAVARAWAWFQGALEGLMGYVRQVPGLIVSTLTSIVIEDLLPLTNLFVKVGRAFGGFFGSFLSWAGGQVMSLLQIIFEVVAPGAMPYIQRAAGAFTSIIRNPIGFVGNLVRAGIQGFRQFAGNFLNHLRASLIGWLTGTMSGAGVYIPQAFSVMEIIKFVLSVLGLTWQNIRGKLVRAVGETAVRALEAGFDIVMTLVTQGPAAAWQKILEGITNLREMVMEQVMTFVRERVVQAAITRLLTSLNPAGAFIQAVIAIYNTVMFFVERMRQIAQVVAAYIDSISAIAAGNIGAAANRVETTMAGLLTLVISFLARIAGLGRVSDAVVNIVNRVRTPVDRALDRVVDWIVAQARRLGRFIAQAGVPQDPQERLRLGKQAALAAVNRFSGQPVGDRVLTPLLAGIRTRYGFARLGVVARQGRWRVTGQINPEFDEASAALTAEAVAPAGGRTLLIGEGNFSFALSIALKTKIGSGLVATDYVVQGRQTVKKRQPAAAAATAQLPGLPAEPAAAETQVRDRLTRANMERLSALGVDVVPQVDATDPAQYPDGTFDVIAFNHPFAVYEDADGRRYLGAEGSNVDLIRGFLTAAKQRIREGGSIIIISSQFRLQRWKLDEIAQELNLEQRVLRFLVSEFPGYSHERTLRSGAAATVRETKQFAIVFTIAPSKQG